MIGECSSNEFVLYVLFYQPPCGRWYVHSHKLYPSAANAFDAAKRFLSPGTPIAVLPVGEKALADAAEVDPSEKKPTLQMLEAGRRPHGPTGMCYLISEVEAIYEAMQKAAS